MNIRNVKTPIIANVAMIISAIVTSSWSNLYYLSSFGKFFQFNSEPHSWQYLSIGDTSSLHLSQYHLCAYSYGSAGLGLVFHLSITVLITGLSEKLERHGSDIVVVCA